MTDFKTFIVAEPKKGKIHFGGVSDSHGKTHNLKQGGNSRYYGLRHQDGVMEPTRENKYSQWGTDWTGDIREDTEEHVTQHPNFCEQILNCSIM